MLNFNIRQRYKELNARVEEKNGTILISEIVASIGRMLNRKMDAVKCIVNKSEEYAEQFHEQLIQRAIEKIQNGEDEKDPLEYYSSKYSLVSQNNKQVD